MSNEMICPYCKKQLLQNEHTLFYYCDCYESKYMNGHPVLWQALIQAKQALEKYADEDMWETGHKWDVEYIQGLFLEHGYNIAKEALEEINRKQY